MSYILQVDFPYTGPWGPEMTAAMDGLARSIANCRIPDDCIDSKRYPLFMARDVMRVLIEQLQAEGATPS